eukprot:CAMPEP_0169229800 /NCGR_PEP_ID=MMETSP1016-20121227/25575_1 /TAXON_ID=342587 /ORGANISM="Karlodinium micrum, Strain CCMP2283" /LENGTH=144 /DNA_ID=CAMNT_0009308699 /DNA_START=149 /DNA_END=583 /DNA_ORIENTATION=+
MVSGSPLVMGGINISPILQWIYGAFTCFSIIAIILGGVGALFYIESNLTVYSYVLLVSAVLDIIAFFVFLFFSNSYCTGGHDVFSSISCGVSDGMSILILTLLIIFTLASIFIVNRCKSGVRNAGNEKLIPYIQQVLENQMKRL